MTIAKQIGYAYLFLASVSPLKEGMRWMSLAMVNRSISAMRKESPSNELIRRTDDNEDWNAMIADVCNRPGTW